MFYRKKGEHHSRIDDVSELLHKIDMNTILFFLGILTAVSALDETGVLRSFGAYLDDTFNSNPYIVTRHNRSVVGGSGQRASCGKLHGNV